MAKIFNYKPAGDFSGSVSVEIPNYKERLNICQELGIVGDLSDKEALKKASAIYDLVALRTTDIKLKHKPSGTEYKDIESLSYSKEGSALINNIAQVILNGIPLGKN